MDITNRTPKPLNVPLPGGKKLFLGPGKTGQVTARAVEHPPLKKLLEAGDLESSEDQSVQPGKSAGLPSGGAAGSTRRQGGAGGAMRQSGDR